MKETRLPDRSFDRAVRDWVLEMGKRTPEEIVEQWEMLGKRERRTRGKGRVIKRRGEGDDGRENDDVEVKDEKVS